MRTLINIIKEHIAYRKQIWKLAKTDLGKTYKGSALGWLWAIIRPTITLFVYWFAFSIGLRKGKPVEGYPFFLWLFAGMIPWFYIRSMLMGGATSLRRYTYLITKIKYPVATIPTFVNISFFFVHLMLLAFMIVVFIAAGYMPDIYYLQLPVYMMMVFLLCNAWGLFAGVISSISRDFLNFVRSITTALLWLSGIFYSANSISIPWLRQLLLFNPITIIVNGYRNTFIYKQWFWETPTEMMNFLIIYAALLFLGVWAYRKLHKDIPDVL